MEWTNRYVYAVTQKLPYKQRADIEQELRSLIEDMTEERVARGETGEQALEKVLLELGPPHAMAAKYRGERRSLIGPELFDAYMSVLKIVLISAAFGMTVVFGIRFAVEPSGVLDLFVDYLLTLFSVEVQSFAWVTVVFAIIEYAGVKIPDVRTDAQTPWKPSSLPPVPPPKAVIRPGEPIASIILIIFFTVLITYSIEWLGVYSVGRSNGLAVVPFLNEDAFRAYVPWIWLLAVAGIGKNVLRFIFRRWTAPLLAYEYVFLTASLALAVAVFANPGIWNAQFMSGLVDIGLVAAGSEGFNTVQSIWNRVTGGMLYLVAIVHIAELAALVWKSFSIRRSSGR